VLQPFPRKTCALDEAETLWPALQDVSGVPCCSIWRGSHHDQVAERESLVLSCVTQMKEMPVRFAASLSSSITVSRKE